MVKKWLIYCLAGVCVLVLIALVLTIWLPVFVAFRSVFGFVCLFFLPGYIWSYVFWRGGEIDGTERWILGIMLSVVSVPLLVFFLNKIGIKINIVNVLLESFVLMLSSLIIIYYKKIKSKPSL